MDRLYQAIRLQFPVIYEILTRINNTTDSRPYIPNSPVLRKTYNLRPRKPVNYRI